jgi:hypothetical protein
VFPPDLIDSAWQVIDQNLPDKLNHEYFPQVVFNALST